jgi:hypothetical protein
MNVFLYFSSWLARSGHLAKSVHLYGCDSYDKTFRWRSLVSDPTWKAEFAGALQRAALAVPHGLQLQSFRGWASSSVLLQALPSSHLTELRLSDMNAVRDGSVADVIAGIAGLTSLRKLWLEDTTSSSSSSSKNSSDGDSPHY